MLPSVDRRCFANSVLEKPCVENSQFRRQITSEVFEVRAQGNEGPNRPFGQTGAVARCDQLMTFLASGPVTDAQRLGRYFEISGDLHFRAISYWRFLSYQFLEIGRLLIDHSGLNKVVFSDGVHNNPRFDGKQHLTLGGIVELQLGCKQIIFRMQHLPGAVGNFEEFIFDYVVVNGVLFTPKA